MEQIKRCWRNLSLRRALVLYVAAAAILALFLCAVTSDLCEDVVKKIYAAYPGSVEKYYLTNEQGERIGDGSYIGRDVVLLSAKDQQTVDIFQAMPSVMTPVYSALCILTAALLFYQNKLKRPLAELRLASEKISNNDLNFTMSIDSTNELGQLCASFETMRAALALSFSAMGQQMEDRKRLNAAFAHDLRTPLTVLKGYNEMLQSNENEQTQVTAVTMQKHISRLEHYVDTMSQLHRLEDTQPSYQRTMLKGLLATLQESAEIICKQAAKQFSAQDKTTSKDLLLDGNFISQVASNLITNAVRYATAHVTLSLEELPDGLTLSISDDGPGFDSECLKKDLIPILRKRAQNTLGLDYIFARFYANITTAGFILRTSPPGPK